MNHTVREYADKFLTFLNCCPSPMHVVDVSWLLLEKAGFEQLSDSKQWQIKPNGKYFVKKNGTAFIAFLVGGKFRPGNAVCLLGAHTDSPCLRVKPNPKSCYKNWHEVNVSLYGGGLWRTWFDRDLSVAGRLVYKKDKVVQSELVRIDRPIMFMPNLAIHLDRESNAKFVMNTEENMKPIFAAGPPGSDQSAIVHPVQDDMKPMSDACPATKQIDFDFIKELANQYSIDVKDLVDFDLCLYDCQAAAVGGLHEDFIFGSHLDNLVSTFTGLTALIDASNSTKLIAESPAVSMLAAYDNEEVGSETSQGAASAWTEWVLRRIQSDVNDPCAFERAISQSFLLSSDVAHAVHPNYRNKHDDNHCSLFHHGPAIKVNANMRYTSTGRTIAKLKRMAEIADVPLQTFTNRNDMPCGSTIGPILSTRLGVEAVDVGNPVLAMHSIREMTSSIDLHHAYRLFKAYFEQFYAVSTEFDVASV